MNHFDCLPDEKILDIMSFCSGADILQLSETCKRFKEIVVGNKRPMGRFNLRLDFNEFLRLSEALALVRQRKFTSLRLVNIEQRYTNSSGSFRELMRLLGFFITDLTIEQSHLSASHFNRLIQNFLPMLKQCKLKKVEIMYPENEPDEVDELGNIELPASNKIHKLEILRLIEVSGKVLKFFSSCQQLQIFSHEVHFYSENVGHVNAFLCLQSRLKNIFLYYNVYATSIHHLQRVEFDWPRMNFVLESFSLVGNISYNLNELLKFIAKQKKLFRVELCFWDVPSRSTMAVICALPKLVEFGIEILRFFDGFYNFENILLLDGLTNKTVKHLLVADAVIATGAIVNMFPNVQSINACCYSKILQLDNVPYEQFGRIRINKSSFNYSRDFIHFKYEPVKVPSDGQAFEAAVTKFIQRNSNFLSAITIGHPNWLNHDSFELSVEFCQNIIEHLPLLTDLTLFCVSDDDQVRGTLAKHYMKIVGG